jgi:hypothetical protein
MRDSEGRGGGGGGGGGCGGGDSGRKNPGDPSVKGFARGELRIVPGALCAGRMCGYVGAGIRGAMCDAWCDVGAGGVETPRPLVCAGGVGCAGIAQHAIGHR